MGDRLDSRRAIDNRWAANGLNGSDSRARGRVRDGGIGGAGRGLSAEFGDFDRDGRMERWLSGSTNFRWCRGSKFTEWVIG